MVMLPYFGNCEEDLPKKPVGRLSVNCRPSVDRQSADCCSFKLQQLKNLSGNVTSLEWISTDVQTLQELRMDFQSTQVYFSLQDVHLVFHYQHPLPSNIKGSKIWSVIKKYEKPKDTI